MSERRQSEEVLQKLRDLIGDEVFTVDADFVMRVGSRIITSQELQELVHEEKVPNEPKKRKQKLDSKASGKNRTRNSEMASIYANASKKAKLQRARKSFMYYTHL